MLKVLNAFKVLMLITIISSVIFLVALIVAVFADSSITGKTDILVWTSAVTLFVNLLLVTFFLIFRRIARREILLLEDTFNMNNRATLLFGEIGIIVCDNNFNIVWVNEFLQERGLSSSIGSSVKTLNWEIAKLIDGTISSLTITMNGRNYILKYIPESRTLLMKDHTEFEELLSTYHNEAKVYGLINIDNFTNIINVVDEELQIRLSQTIRGELLEWAKSHNALMRTYSTDGYLMIMNRLDFDAMQEEKFKILDRVKIKAGELNADITISMGVAYGSQNPIILNELAKEALELAVSRGGDQVVVKPYGEDNKFFGGKSEAKLSKSKVAIRVFTKTFMKHLATASKVFISGHKFGDFDSLGSGLGVAFMAKKMGKEVKHIIKVNTLDNKAAKSISKYIDPNYIKSSIVTPAEAIKEIDENSILIVTDTNAKKRVEALECIDMFKHVIVIDHHRTPDEVVNSVEKYVEAGASSACEIVTEIIYYSNLDISDMPSYIPNIILCGIVLDTYRFRMRTNERTYEASGLLKKWGADPLVVDEIMKDTLEEFELKQGFLTTMKRLKPNIVLLTSPHHDKIYHQSILAQVAQEALGIQGVDASFVIGKVDTDRIAISGRSNGKVNVHVVCEKFGGGGHFTSSGAQVAETTVEKMVTQLIDILNSIDVEGFNIETYGLTSLAQR